MKDGTCESIFLGLDGAKDRKGNAVWFFGGSFFQEFYTVFDFGNKRVGFAAAKRVDKLIE